MKHNSSKRLQLNNHELHLCHTVSTELSASNVTSQMLCCTEECNRNVSWRDQDEPHQATMPGGLLGINSFESQHTPHSPGITAHAFWSQGQLIILISIKSLMVWCHFAVSSCHCLLKHTDIRMMDVDSFEFKFTGKNWVELGDITSMVSRLFQTLTSITINERLFIVSAFYYIAELLRFFSTEE